MRIFPAIDLYEEKAVRLYQGDYDQMTVYSDDPVKTAIEFEKQGAQFLHVVDLEGAKFGLMCNYDIIKEIVDKTDLFIEVGGGIRSMAVIEAYISAGVGRVIIGTAAVNNRGLLKEAISLHPDQIAVGADVKNGFVATRGWVEDSKLEFYDFCRKMQDEGVKTLICTDVFKDGAMQGTNREMYKKLKDELSINIIASGGISNLDDVKALKDLGMYGAIIGRAYYTGAIDIAEAIKIAK